MPSFWIGLILLWVFAFSLGWFPLRGYQSCVPGANSLSSCTFTTQHYPWLVGLGAISLTAFLGAVFLIAGIGALAWGLFTKSSGRRVLGGAGVVVGAGVLILPNVNFTLLNLADWSIHAFLPMLALVAISSAGTILLMQTSMLEVMGEDFILTARAKGLSERVVRKRHAARNAYLPIVTSLAISLGFVVGGAIVLEQIFSFSGLGYYFLLAVERHDQFLAGADLFLIAILVICGNIAADIMYGVLDPRVRL
jgi:peptide/nickel transport system permease protein